MDHKLVIVESPTKMKTLKKILGRGYEIAASNGHVIDLPKSKLGIDVKNNFEPEYTVMKNREKVIKNLKELAKKSSKVLLASDPDREGESIAWHIANALNLKNDKCRIEFNEVTENAVKNAVKNPRDIDMKRVHAQQARRILDRLVGYKISPLLWEVLGYNTSAGRVQSVALKLICDLEEKIKHFKPEKYWEVKGLFDKKLELNLYKIAEEKDDKVKDKNVLDKLTKDTLNQKFEITTYKISKKTSTPPLPFKTSSLQQAASSQLGFSPSRTMKVAQSLYEGVEIAGEPKGLITYMRTDSTRISEEAKELAKKFIEENYGKDYIGKGKAEKAKKNTQDAHEAIRPTYTLKPEEIKSYLSGEQFKLYQLIFNRFITSRLANLEYDQLELIASYKEYEFRNTYNKITFEGYYKLYKENEDFEKPFPKIKEGDKVELKELLTKEGETKPPARYSEASLIKKLEAEGIGRPSTYATIVETLKKREYVSLQDRHFIPTNLGYSVTKELLEHFPNIMNLKFTSNMEENLDEIAHGNKEWVQTIKVFYQDLEEHIKKFKKDAKEIKNKIIHTDVECIEDRSKMLLKTGRFGYYLECELNNKHTRSIPADIVEYEEMRKGNVHIKDKLKDVPVKEISSTPTDVKHPECSKLMVLKKGRFGHYLQCEDEKGSSHTLSIPKEIKLEALDVKKDVLILASAMKEIDDRNKKILKEIGKCDLCGSDMEIRKGKWGPFIGCSNYPNCKNIKKFPKN